MADKRSKADMTVVGTSGLKQQDGKITEEFHPKLVGDYGPLVYREMTDNDETIGAIGHSIRSLVRQVEWRVEAASEETSALEAAEFVESCIEDLDVSIEDTISEMLSMLNYGWSYFEIIYKLRKGETDDPTTNSLFSDGKLGWKLFASRSQDSLDHWEFDEKNKDTLLGMWQLDEDEPEPVLIPLDKSLLFRTEKTKNNPEGRSIFRNAVIPYFYKKRIQMIEAIGIERDMTGLITMEVPLALLSSTASASDKILRTELEAMLGQLKRDEREFALVPSELDREGKPTGYKLKLLSSGGTRQIDTTAVKDYYKVGILQSVMAQFIQLGMASVGSFALASSQTNMFSTALNVYMDIISDTFSRNAIGPLMKMNGVSPEDYPKFVHGDIETPNLAEIGAYIQALSMSGQLPFEDKALQSKLLEYAKLPISDEDTFEKPPVEEPLLEEPEEEPEEGIKEIDTPENEVKKNKVVGRCTCGGH